MKIEKRSSLVVGFGLLALLALFILLVSQRTSPVVPDTPVVSSVVNATTSIALTTEHDISTFQAEPVTSLISSTEGVTTSNMIAAHWQQFSSKTSDYTISHPPAAITQFTPSPPLIEHIQIGFAASEGIQPATPPFDLMFINVRVYENSAGKSIEAFLSELYERSFRKPITHEKLQELMGHPIKVGNITGYWMDWRITAARMQFLIAHKNHFYTFTLVHQFSSVELSTEEVEFFNRIVSTINLK